MRHSHKECASKDTFDLRYPENLNASDQLLYMERISKYSLAPDAIVISSPCDDQVPFDSR